MNKKHRQKKQNKITNTQKNPTQNEQTPPRTQITNKTIPHYIAVFPSKNKPCNQFSVCKVL